MFYFPSKCQDSHYHSILYMQCHVLLYMLFVLGIRVCICSICAAVMCLQEYLLNECRRLLCWQEAEETLFVRRQRLQSVGGFSLLLLHSLSHIKIKDMSSDISPAFQRLFFKVQDEHWQWIVNSLVEYCHVKSVFWFAITDTAGMSGGAVSGQTWHPPLRTGSQFVYLVSRPRHAFRRLKGDSVRPSCCLPPFQD